MTLKFFYTHKAVGRSTQNVPKNSLYTTARQRTEALQDTGHTKGHRLNENTIKI